MDTTRIQALSGELTAKQAAYDAALREHAAATLQVAAGPADATAAARLKTATTTLAAARTQVDAARRLLDTARIGELVVIATGDGLLGSIAGNQVLSLFPVGLEAKLDPGQRLRVRVWPDSMSTSTHDPRLMPTELEAGQRYWRAEVSAATDEHHRAAWRELADALGTTRAAWVARVLTPANQAALAPGVEPVFPPVAMLDEAAPFVPRAGVLPDRWIAVGFRDNVRVFDHVGAPIPIDLAVGLDTTPSEAAALTNREGEPIQLPPRMRWLTDFNAAKQAGMAMEIPLAAGVDRLDLLLLFGVRITQSATDSADGLAALMTGHRFSRGLAFVPQDTPTNNSAAGGSGLPSRAARIEAGFDLERRPRAFPPDLQSNGVTAARAFGLDPDVFSPLPASGATAQLASEPDGFEPEVARAMQTTLWQVTLGATMEDFLGLDPGRADALRDHFREHVRAGGPVPAVRVGRQPYGVLPVTLMSDFVVSPSDGIDARLLPLLRTARSWWGLLRQGELFTGSPEDAFRYLGRSTRLFAETTTQNPAGGGSNHWASLAGTLARTSRNLIPDTWRTAPIVNTVEGQPQPVERPAVDDETAPALGAFASAGPTALLGSALPSSVLGRTARQAALLEWGRLARAVCDAALDVPSRTSLAATAAQNGIDTYIQVVVNAMNRPTTATTGAVGPIAGGQLHPAPPIGADPPIRPPIIRPPVVDPPVIDPSIFDPPIIVLPPRPGPGIDADEAQRIKTLVGNLAQPNTTCPGAERLASFRRALTILSQVPADRLESAFLGTLDLCNHRIDAWITSLASKRLTSIRASAPRGVVIGGWGCLQDVRPADPQDQEQGAEFIHTPSLDHAAAAAVLRSAARRATAAGSSHADIDLSSRRVRLARWILEGVRNGRSLSELLGIRFERSLKGTTAEPQLGLLRGTFPSRNGTGVLDGLKLLKSGPPPASDPAVAAAAKALDETIDALTDALTAESVYQFVKGNPAGALLDLDAIANGEAPPPLRVTETPSSGTRLTHRLIVTVPVGATAPGWTTGATPRSRAEPLLDAWCGLMLGPAARTALTVDAPSGVAMSIPLTALNIAAIDVMSAARDGGAELADRAVLAARQTNPAMIEATVRTDRAWKDLVGLCAVMSRTIALAQPLRPDALEQPGALLTAPAEDFGDLPARASEAVGRLSSVGADLAARTNPADAVTAAAAFGVCVPGAFGSAAPNAQDLDALQSAVEDRLAASAAAAGPRDRLRAVFGGELPGLVTFTPRDAPSLVTATSPPPVALFAGDQIAPMAWLDTIGRSRPAAARLSEILQRVDIAGGTSPSSLRVAQAPWADGDKWIATAFAGKGGKRPDGRLSVLIHAPAGFTATQALGGLLVDTWTETIPSERRDTAIALRYNSPGTRAPQSILLAVNPDPSRLWTTDTLVAILRETLEMARMRMQPPPTFSQSGQLPLAWLGQRPGATGISFSL